LGLEPKTTSALSVLTSRRGDTAVGSVGKRAGRPNYYTYRGDQMREIAEAIKVAEREETRERGGKFLQHCPTLGKGRRLPSGEPVWKGHKTGTWRRD